MKPVRAVTVVAGLLLAASFALFGCSTGTRVLKSDQAQIEHAENLGLSISLRHVSGQEIDERFGDRNNPFMQSPALLSEKQFLLFELLIEPEPSFNGPFVLNSKDIELQFGGINVGPKNQFLLSRYWSHELQQEIVDTRYKGWTMGKVDAVIDKNLLPNKVRIDRGAMVRKLVLFEGGFPRYGNATVYVPLLKDGSLAKNFRFDFEFGYEE
ncbi:MAG: hypothetical protein JXQ30_15890 [Spirochaetes bacterium]|nr:hypothetical protein [Spirochaetota bacterium]